jgi:predicted transcriptional regulator
MTKRLSGRTRQVLEVIYRLGEASAGDIQREVPDLPSYSATRSILRSLEDRGLIRHREKGMRYVYSPTESKRKASRKALSELLDTFFDGSPLSAMKALLEISQDGEDALDIEAIERMIDEAGRQGR